MTAAIMAETGLDEDILRDLVHSFYATVRRDTVLGPVFAARITDSGAASGPHGVLLVLGCANDG
jgi:hemoglobin